MLLIFLLIAPTRGATPKLSSSPYSLDARIGIFLYAHPTTSLLTGVFSINEDNRSHVFAWVGLGARRLWIGQEFR
jgi:hypothetical protein